MQKGKNEYALVILAAGIGARYGGGVKQLKKVGPAGEIIMDYAIYDALEAGFNKIVFIIRREIEADFRAVIGDRIEAVCQSRGVEVAYAYQEKEDLPQGYLCPADRKKPWGTGHALLACRGLLHGPFVVINADDYYGKTAYGKLLSYLRSLPDGSAGQYCMAGFRLGRTLSEYGGVTRGICCTDETMNLTSVKETRGIVKKDGEAAVLSDGQWVTLDREACVSMNMWGFTPDILSVLEKQFHDFLEEQLHVVTSEYVLPEIVDRLLAEDQAAVQVLPTEDRWFGITYQEDAPLVEEAFRRMVEQNVYQAPLYGPAQ